MSTTEDDPTLQPTDAAGFEKQIEALRAKNDYIGLPGITLAMWPPSVFFGTMYRTRTCSTSVISNRISFEGSAC